MRFIHGWTEDTTTIAVEGLQQTVRMLQVTDSHIALIDQRDSDYMEVCADYCKRMRTKRKDCEGNYISPEDSFAEAMEKAASLDLDLLALTGDIIFFPSQANVEHVKTWSDKVKVSKLYTAGNHDWCYPNLKFNDELRREWWPALEPLHGGDTGYAALDIKGIRFIAIDDSTYQINETQLEFTKSQLRAGLPTVLLTHIPLSIATLRATTIDIWGDPILVGDPDWDLPRREKWGTRGDTATTLEFVRLMSGTPNLAAIFCGHLHFHHADTLRPHTLQYVGLPGFLGGMRLVEFRPLVPGIC